MNGITSSGAKGINALGPRYMGKYHPLMEIGPRYLLIQGTHRELTEGNGPPFALDLPHIDRDILHHLQYDSMPGDKETWNDYCALCSMAAVWLMVFLKPGLAPRLPKSPLNERMASLKTGLPIMGIFFLVIGGIYGGMFTATEGGAIGAFGTLLLICVPIFVPIAKVFGWDLIWFGVIITVLDNMASITPPFGISLFVMKEVAGVTLGAMYRSAVPVKTPGKAGGLKRGDRSKRFLLFAYGELQQLKLLHLPVFFFLVPYVEPNFPFSYSYRAYKISSRPETRSCYFTNFFKMFRYLNSAFSF